jgi:hypothetical protein
MNWTRNDKKLLLEVLDKKDYDKLEELKKSKSLTEIKRCAYLYSSGRQKRMENFYYFFIDILPFN